MIGRVSVSAPLWNQNSLLRARLCFVLALTVLMAIACGSESVTPPTPTAAPASTSAPAYTATPSIPAPPAGDGPAARAIAPSFSLPSAQGDQVSLSALIEEYQAVVLVFYRGFF